MSVGVLLITHHAIGEQLLRAATETLGDCPTLATCLAVCPDDDPTRLLEQANALIQGLNRGSGVLILTDAYGSTPSNIALQLARTDTVQVIAGLNLPMLLRVFNYTNLPLTELTAKAVQGGQNGVTLVPSKEMTGEDGPCRKES